MRAYCRVDRSEWWMVNDSRSYQCRYRPALAAKNNLKPLAREFAVLTRLRNGIALFSGLRCRQKSKRFMIFRQFVQKKFDGFSRLKEAPFWKVVQANGTCLFAPMICCTVLSTSISCLSGWFVHFLVQLGNVKFWLPKVIWVMPIYTYHFKKRAPIMLVIIDLIIHSQIIPPKLDAFLC